MGIVAAFLAVSFGHAAEPIAQVHFVDVAEEVGIDFVHHNGASSEKLLPETNGSGSAFFDYDGDGDLDLYLVNSGDLIAGRGESHNRLYRNNGEVKEPIDGKNNFRFSDVTWSAGVQGGRSAWARWPPIMMEMGIPISI